MAYTPVTLDAVEADSYEALDRVNRRLYGYGRLADNYTGEPVAQNETIKFTDINVGDVVSDGPATVPPDASAQTTRVKEFRMEHQERISLNLSGEQRLELSKSVDPAEMRTIALEKAYEKIALRIDQYVGGKLLAGASRAIGTPGTLPFGTAPNGDDSQLVDLRTIMVGNNAGLTRPFVLNYEAYANLLKVKGIKEFDKSGTTAPLQLGQFPSLASFSIIETNIPLVHTQGRKTPTTLRTAAAVGDTTVAMTNAAGAQAGDLFTMAGHQYVVNGVDAANNVTISDPGVQTAQATGGSNTVVFATQNSYKASICATPGGAVMSVRPPVADDNAEAAIITDPVTGWQYRVARYGNYLMSSFYIQCVYGAAVLRGERIGMLIS